MTKDFLTKVIEKGSFFTKRKYYVLAKYREDFYAVYSVSRVILQHRQPNLADWKLEWHGDIKNFC